jgi:undecaprenyl diphosphate synthase
MANQIKHVAIIMDGNGRWAKMRRRPRLWGHVRGSNIVSEIVEEADELDIESLTMFAFSTENWSRPPKEISGLFKLLDKYIDKERKRILANNIQFKVIGETSQLPEFLQTKIEKLESESATNMGLKLNFAFNYGSRAEILKSINQFIQDNPGKLISEPDLAQGMYNPAIGEIDLLIRTSGEQRISNFLLWQIAYAELFFSKTYWPDFSRAEFRSIIDSVAKRERRFGSVDSLDGLNEVQLLAQKSLRVLREDRINE